MSDQRDLVKKIEELLEQLRQLLASGRLPVLSGQDRKKRPFSPPADEEDIGICGRGDKTQVDVHDTATTVQLLADRAADHPKYSPELGLLAEEINELFNRRGMSCLRRKRAQVNDQNVELTIVEDPTSGVFYLAYARPVETLER